MVTVAAVRTGTKYALDYVRNLKRGVERHWPAGVPLRFVLYGDAALEGIEHVPTPPYLTGWWAKLFLFASPEPLIYFDLDTVITDDLSRLVGWDGFGVVKDPHLAGCNSSVLRLTGREGHVWAQFRPGVMGMLRGDQDWLNVVMPEAPTFPKAWFPSFKADRATESPPAGAMAVLMHGFPKPHQISSGWVPRYWT